MCIITPKVGRTGLNLTEANHAIIILQFRVLTEQCQAFAQVVNQGQHRVPHTWLPNKGPSVYNTHASDLDHYNRVAPRSVLQGWISQLKITTSTMYFNLQYGKIIQSC